MACYIWLIAHVSPQKASTYALVNPVVALVLGIVILDERVTMLTLGAAGAVVGGVAIILFSKRLGRRGES